MSVAQAYFDAWNRHDPAGIMAAFQNGGTYSDPATGGPLAGEAIGQYAAALFAAFPDLWFDLVSAAPAGDRLVAAQWVMRGANSGPLFDNPPTGKEVTVPGADFLRVEGDKIAEVKGYFDQKSFLEQLGLQVNVQPYTMGPVTFGTSVHMNTGEARRPGAFSLTAIFVKEPQDNAEVDRLAAAVMDELAQAPGFIGTVLTTVGLRGHTVTAWEDAEAPRRMLASPAHKEAMARFFGSGVASGGMTSVWVPARINSLWIRCESCGRMVNTDRPEIQDKCECGAPPPPRVPYW